MSLMCNFFGLQPEKAPAQNGGFPKIRHTFLGVPVIRTVAFLGLHWGPPMLGNCQIACLVSCIYEVDEQPVEF